MPQLHSNSRSSSSTQTVSDKCMMGIGVVGAEREGVEGEGGVWGVAEKSTGRVTNGRLPGCQLTVAVLYGGLVNGNDRTRGEKERGQGYFK